MSSLLELIYEEEHLVDAESGPILCNAMGPDSRSFLVSGLGIDL